MIPQALYWWSHSYNFSTCYDLQYLTMRLSEYMNAPTMPAFLALRHGMEYLMRHPHEPVVYSLNNILKTNERPHHCFFKAGDA